MTVDGQNVSANKFSHWGWVALSVKAGSPWMSHQFMAGLTYRDKQPSTLTFTLTDNLVGPMVQNMH